MANIFQQTEDETTGGKPNLVKQVMDARGSLTGGIQGIFDKLKGAAGGDGSPQVGDVPVGRLVASPRRQLGKGTRDTILNGADGI